jgi:hypothetical protein
LPVIQKSVPESKITGKKNLCTNCHFLIPTSLEFLFFLLENLRHGGIVIVEISIPKQKLGYCTVSQAYFALNETLHK